MKHHIHSVQTFVRVIYTNGVVAGIMAPSTELDPALVLQQDLQAGKIINRQAQIILDQLGTVGAEGLYDAALESAKTPAKKHEAPRPKSKEQSAGQSVAPSSESATTP